MSDGVLTTKDFINQKTITGATKNVVPENKKNVRIDYKYRFPSAPMGESQTTIQYAGKPLKLEMVDGVYTVPKNWSMANKEKFHNFIQTLGFIDECESVGYKTEKKESEAESQKEKTKVYIVGHPDNTKDGTGNVTGSVTIKIGKANQKFDCVDGKVTTEDKKVYESFIKKGWYEVSIKEKEEAK